MAAEGVLALISHSKCVGKLLPVKYLTFACKSIDPFVSCFATDAVAERNHFSVQTHLVCLLYHFEREQ